MATSFAADTVTLIHDNGLAVSGVSMFMGWMPPTPDMCLSVIDRQAPQSEHTMGPSGSLPAVEYSTIQVFVRHKTYDDCWAVVTQVHNLLRWFSGTLNGTEYLLIREQYSPAHLGRDENNRTTFSLNYTGMRRP